MSEITLSGEENQGLKCSQVADLFSPWLDGEISVEESDMLAGHLLHCDSCRRELDLWKKISETMKDDLYSGEPSPDFCAGVMSRINGEQFKAKPGRRLFSAWRTSAAAAAAAVMLFAGSWGVKVALNPEKPPEVVQIQPGGNSADIGVPPEPEKTPQPDNSSVVGGPGTNVTPNTTVNIEGARPVAPATPGESQFTDTVLLSSNREILSTILKISVPSIKNASSIALSMASELGGGGQELSRQKRGSGDLSIMRITVPRENGSSLLTRLTRLGEFIDRVDEKKDISASYTEIRNRLKEIQARIGAGAGPDEKDQLESEASGLRRQIESWNKDLDSYVVILWLEQ